jgi:hypothetical protein
MENDNESWLKDPKQLESVAKRLESEHGALQAETKGYLRCYYDRPVTGADYTRPYRELAVFQTLRESHGGNLTREVIDAAASIICRPLSAEVLPKGAEFELEQGCKQASRLIEGVFDNSDFTSIAKRAFKDGCTASIGPAKAVIDPLTEEIKFERVNPLELYWPDDGTDEPRTLMQISPVSRDKLMALYPQHKGRIKDLPPWSPAAIVGVDPPGTRKDVGTVKGIEAWHVAMGEDHPGRHSMVAGDIILEDEKWTFNISPIFSFRWSTDFRGYAGVSLARIISRYDGANRRLLQMVYAGLAGAVPRILAHEDSEVDGLSDVEYETVKWSGPIEP